MTRCLTVKHFGCSGSNLEKDVIIDFFKIFNETIDAAGVFANEGKMVIYNICRCTQLKIVDAMGQGCPDMKDIIS